MGLTENVMNETCPSTMFVPMLMRMETPMAAMNSRGSIHDVVDSTSNRMMTGTRMSAAPPASFDVLAVVCAVSAASPDTALPEPASSTRARSAGTAVLSEPSATVTWNSAAPSR